MAAKTTDPIDILLEMGIDLDNLSEEEDYLSALIEATNALTIKDPSDPRIAPLQKEILKVRKKRKEADPKFRVRKTTVSPDRFFDRKKPQEEQSKPVPGQLMIPGDTSGALVKPDSLRPPEVEEDGEKIKKEPNILQDILDGINSIIGILKSQNKLDRKRAEKDRKKLEKSKRSTKEGKLEKGPLEKFVNQSKKLLKPVQSLFGGLFEFIKNILIGRLLVKVVNWMSDSENQEKLKAIGNFLKNTWPALLAAYLLFGNSLGRFAVNLVKVIGGFAIKLLKTIIPQLLTAVKKLGFKKSMMLGGLAVGGTMLAGRLLDGGKDDVDLTQPDGRQGAPGSDGADGRQGASGSDGADGRQGAPGSDGADGKQGAPGSQTGGKTPYERVTEAGFEVIAADNGFISFEKEGSKRSRTGTFTLQGNTKEERFNNYFDGSDTFRTLKLNGGGQVPGSGPNKDTVPAMLAPGEFVMSRGAVQKYGTDTFAAMNAAGGGTNLPRRMNGITYAVGGGLMGSMSDYGYEEKNEEQSPTVKGEMEERKTKGEGKNKGEGKEKQTNGGIFGSIKRFFGFGGSKSGEEEGEKSGGGGSLKGLTGQDFRDLAYIVSGEAQRGTDDEYGVAAAVLNRVADPAWPNTIKEVGSQDGQFEAVYTGKAFDDPELAAKLASSEGQAKIVEAMKMLKGRTDFKGTSQYGNMGSGDIKFSDRGNFYHYKEQVSKTDPPPSPVPNFYQKFIGTGGPAVSLNGTKSSAGGITASPGSGSGSGSHTTSLSGLIGGFDSKIMESLKVSGGGGSSIIKRSPTSGSSIEPPHTTTLSSIVKRTGSGMGSSGSSSSGQNSPTRPADASPPNTIPPIDAEAMISQEKIKVLGIAVG